MVGEFFHSDLMLPVGMLPKASNVPRQVIAVRHPQPVSREGGAAYPP
jgi:hypothetical protein